jgi:aerobic-type carbon monoxide dehydrogenase small subunit (CoxS/CutS family)
MPSYTITVNAKRHTIDVDEDTPLLWVLRDTLGLTGTKYGCGVGECGNCAVVLNGALTRSCLVQISAADGAAIQTIEGLSPDRSHPVQQAWIAEQVPQCGWCHSGQILAAVDLLKAHPHPTDADIDAAMSSYLCRCGTQQRIRRAIHRAAGAAGSAQEVGEVHRG